MFTLIWWSGFIMGSGVTIVVVGILLAIRNKGKG